ncbi:hypothetical protein GH733_016589 [Mirounga leonina]|nr:hypothetical protein GH733_016589 [Mirounga leonina]
MIFRVRHSQSNNSTPTHFPSSASLTCSVTTKPNRSEHLLDGLFSTLPHSSAGPQVSQTPHHLSLTCVFPADIRCHSCYKVPVLGCVDRQSCRLEPGQQCLTTNVYLGNIPLFSKMWVFSNLRCGTPGEPCQEAFNQTNHKLGLTYNTTCCSKDSCNSPAPRPTPALTPVLLASVAGFGLWLLH